MLLAVTVWVLVGVSAVLWPRARARRQVLEPARVPGGPPVSGRWRALVAVSPDDVFRHLDGLAVRRPQRLLAVVALSAALPAWVFGGPVAALVGGVYGAFGARVLVRRSAGRRDRAARARVLDDLSALAADLRAGLPPASASAARPDGTAAAALPADRRLPEITAAVWRLAETTGAPAADLVERIEADARAADRARASAVAEAAGAQATTWLLAALPLGGIALGYAMGAAPLHILLHTPVGAACAIGAVVLQGAGLLWSDRLMPETAR